MVSPFDQNAFRIRNDDGNETTATWVAAENINASLNVDTNYRIRFEVEETFLRASALTQQLQYNKNSAGWNNVNGTSLVVRSSLSPNVADAAVTTNQLTSSALGFVAGEFDEGDGGAGNPTLNNQQTEFEHCFQIRSADVVNGDTIQLRGVRFTTLNLFQTYTNTPTLTVIEAAAEALAGVSAGVSTAAGALAIAKALLGTSAGVSTAAGALGITRPLAALSAGVSAAVGALTVTAPGGSGDGAAHCDDWTIFFRH